MIEIRPIEAGELEEFCGLTDRPDDVERSLATLRRLIESSETSPSWCFVAEDRKKLIGRLGYLAFPSSRSEVRLFGLHLPWYGGYIEVGRKLLTESLRAMQREGARELEARLDSEATMVEQRRVLLERVGLDLLAERTRFVWETSPPRIPSPRLSFRSLEQVGEDAYVDAIRQVGQATLDRIFVREQEQMGEAKAARYTFDGLKDVDADTSGWQLAFTAEGTLAGLVVPQHLSEARGTINYIGVVPEKRGQGYVNDLLAYGTDWLARAGCSSVVADIDDQNAPMRGALETAGYKSERRFWVYRAPLDQLIPSDD